MNPRLFLNVAKELVNKKNHTPGDIRTALSRAYYAVFLVGIEKLKEIGIDVAKNPKSHDSVYKFLHNCGHEDVINASSKMNDLRSLRIKADYNMEQNKVENQQNALFSVLTAEKVIKVYDTQFSDKTNKVNLENSIKSWRKSTNN